MRRRGGGGSSLTATSSLTISSSSSSCSSITSSCCSAFSSSSSSTTSTSSPTSFPSTTDVHGAVCDDGGGGGSSGDCCRRQLDLACQSHRQSHERRRRRCQNGCRPSASSSSSSSSASNVMRERCSVTVGNVSSYSSRSSYRIMLLGIIGWIITIATSTTQGIQQISDPYIVEHPSDLYVVRNEPATLNCKAEGRPPPIITWYRDRQLVTTSNENSASHRMVLPSGQLFIMKVSHKNNKIDKSDKQPDVGEYYCNATNPETRVSSISKMAKLEVAVIKDDFREQPQDLDAAVGLKAILHCKAPHGEPDPEIRWEKDRSPIDLDDRVKVDKYGSLHISDARKDDSGTYQCIAANIAGERESRPARLSIKEKPVIIDGPKNSVVKESGSVLLQCHATGDPELVVSWRKKEGEIRTERSILADRSLEIRNAQVSDEGTYVCRVENTVGWQEAEAKLTVHSRPSFVFAPRDKVVGLGRRVSMRCEVTGSPAPGVYWSRVSDQTLMMPNKNHGRFRVTEEGMLIIESVRTEDAGEYACHGESLAGSAYAKARLEIKDVDSRPPPIINVGPQNQTLPTQDVALLPCTASGEPAPGISWLKNGVTLSLENPRFTIVESGTLQISDLQQSDSGLYTCKAVSETGETTWTASLVVEPTTNLRIIFHRNQEPNTFPAPPSKPVISDIAETMMRLTWRTIPNTGASAVVCYIVEYFSHETGEGWTVLSDSVTETSVLVRNLQPNTSYMFLVRAKNSHGLSQPSPVTSPTRTKGDSVILIRPTPPQLDLSLVTEKLSVPVVRLWTPEVLSSTAVKLTWEVQRNQRFIEGYYVKYRPVGDRDDSAGGNAVAGQTEATVETVQSPVATLYILSGLQKYATYEIRLQPFYSTVKGVESNTVRARTLEDVPSAPPRNIRTSLLDNKTLILQWDPPAKQHRNGVLYGYKIYIYGNESKFNHEVQVNATVESAYVANVLKEVFYKLYMTAYNRIGEGVRSEVIYIGQFPGELNQPLLMEPWFIATLVATVGAAIWLALCLFSIWIYRRRTERKKGKKNRAVTAPIHRTEENGRTGNIPNQIPLLATNNGDLGCRTNQACMPPCCYDNKSPSDGESKVNGSESQLNHTYQTLESLQRANPELGDPLEFPFVDGSYNAALPLPPLVKSVYNRGAPPLPYATATLMGNGSGGFHRKMSAGGTIPNPEAYMIQPNAPSCDSFGKRGEGECRPDYGTLNLDDRMRGCNVAQQMLFKHPVAGDHLSQSSVNTYQSDRARASNGGGPPKCSIVGHPNDFASYGLPAMCSDCDQRQYDSPCDRLSSLDSQASMTPFSNSYHNTPPTFLPDPMLLTYDDFNSLYPGEKVQDCSDVDHRSVASSDDAEVDFANAVSRVAELSGLTIASSNGMQFLDCKDSQKAKKSAKHRQRAPRPSSPCSTDSSYSAAPRRPYPKSDRKKHIQERVTRTGTAPTGSRASEQNQVVLALNNNRRYNDLEDHLSMHLHSSIPYSTVNSSSSRGGGGGVRVGNFGPAAALACSIQAPLGGGGSVEGSGGGGGIQMALGGSSSDAMTSSTQQPSLLLAFDTRNTPIV